MEAFKIITSRNLKIYFRDRGAVFFSLLSMIIVICLMVFFLGDMNIDELTELLGRFSGRDAAADKENVQMLILTWTCGGIISINAVTVTLAVYSVMIKDRSSGKLNSIYTAPISRTTIAAGYVSSAWLASVIVCMITLFITETYCVLKGLSPFSTETHVQLFVMIIINSFVYAALMYLMAMLVRTESGWSGMGTVVGTLVGFLGGIYIPIGSLSKTIGNIMKCTPIIYGTALFRNIMTKDIMDATFFGVPSDIIEEYSRVMGIELEIFGHVMSTVDEALLLLMCGIILLAVDISLMKYGKRTDR